jgi:hypothetical protein
MQSRRRHRTEESLEQILRRILPTPATPTQQHESIVRAIHVLEDFSYQYHRNFREYNQNIRQLDHHLQTLTRSLTIPSFSLPVRPTTLFHPTYTFSFETDVIAPTTPSPTTLNESDILEHVEMLQYDVVQLPGVTTCPITLEQFHHGEDLCRLTGCGHIFKREPILQWLRRTPVCPVCRRELRQTTPAAPVTAALNSVIQNIINSIHTDASGNRQLMYEFEMPLEMLARHFDRQEEEEPLRDESPVD